MKWYSEGLDIGSIKSASGDGEFLWVANERVVHLKMEWNSGFQRTY